MRDSRKFQSCILSGENLATVMNFVSTTDFRVVDNQLYIYSFITRLMVRMRLQLRLLEEEQRLHYSLSEEPYL